MATRCWRKELTDFGETIAEAYATDGPAIDLGRGVHEGAVAPEAVVQVPLTMMNRHGLIAGATGTGKTRRSRASPSSSPRPACRCSPPTSRATCRAWRAAGATDGPAAKRAAELGLQFAPTGFPVEYLSLGGIGPGVPVRATVSDFGPQLLAKVLGANETQEQSLGLVFHYADEKGLPLLDLSDLRALLTFLTSDEGKASSRGSAGSRRRRSACCCAPSSGSRTAAATSSSASRSSTSPTCSAPRRTGAE